MTARAAFHSPLILQNLPLDSPTTFLQRSPHSSTSPSTHSLCQVPVACSTSALLHFHSSQFAPFPQPVLRTSVATASMPKKKGGKVQGRAKQKVKAQGASSGGKPPWMKKFARSFDDDSDDNDGPTFRGFAQRSGQATPRDSGLKLRHQAISFVSAGTNTPIEKEVKQPQEEAIIAALVGGNADEEEDIEDSMMQDTVVDDVDDSTFDATMVTDTDVEISKSTRAMHIHEHIEAPIAAFDGAADPRPDTTAAPFSKSPTPPQDTLSFVIDTEGDPSLSRPTKSKPDIPARPSSPTPSDSSEEVILFHGRNKPKVVDDPIISSRNTSTRQQAPKPPVHKVPVQKTPLPEPTPQRQTTEAHVTDELLAALLGDQPARQASTDITARGWGAKAPQWDKQVQNPALDFAPAPPGSWWRTKGMPRPDLDYSQTEKSALDAAEPRVAKVSFAGPEEQNGAEETVASLRAEWDRALREKKRAKQVQQEDDDEFEDVEEDDTNAPKPANKTLALDLGMKTNRRGKRGRKRSNKLLRDLQSDQTDEDEAAYNDYMENLKAQLEADEDIDIPTVRTAEGGPSLVVDGQAIDEDDVLDRATRQANFDELRMLDTDSDSEEEEIGQDIDDFEDDDDDDVSDFGSTDLEDELEENEREDWEDEDDLRQRRIDAMDDETLARLWAKQAEMGFSDDELVIDDGTGMEVDDLDGFGDLDDARAGLASLANSSFGKSTSKRGNNKPSFPSASALADTVDQYGDAGFDIMDFDRPSLRPKRGRKGKMPPELEALSDEDLREEVIGQWSNDRDKKRMKKAEREELRMQGMLGSAGKKGQADLSQKYLQGMTVAQIHDELRLFLRDAGKTTRSFPPMGKDDRKALHEIANALALKSKSVGAGKHRQPILYKTTRTPAYSDATFRRVTAAASRGFLKNSAFKGKKPKGGALPKGQRAGKGRGADTTTTGLRHGDVVGGGAKEIGRENFGHRLLEKMGWQKGTALGGEGSSGLLTPVEQVMRTGRSGLG
ncbi:hypothetical protein Q7P37_008366 [Cladosporium fusiforme]